MRIPGSIFHGMSGRQIDEVALDIIKRVQPDVLRKKIEFDIERFSEFDLEDMTGMVVDYRNDLPEEIYGYTDTSQNLVVINASLVDDPFLSDIRFLRSTLGHETGHCFLHVPTLRKLRKSKVFTQSKLDETVSLFRREGEIPTYCNPEWQAHRFAAGLLVPASSLHHHLERGESVMKLAEIFGVTKKFIESRMKGLKVVK